MPGPDGLTGVLYPILKEEITLISHKIFPEYRGGRNAFNSFCEVSIQFSSVTQSCLTLCDPMNRSTPGLPIHHQLSESTQTHNHLILCRPLLLLPSTFPSIRVFSKESAFCIRWPKYGSFSFNISTSNTQDWCPLGWTGWISLQPKELPRVFSNTTIKHTHTHTQKYRTTSFMIIDVNILNKNWTNPIQHYLRMDCHPINAEKAFDKLQHSFLIKTLNKLGIQGTFSTCSRSSTKNSQLTSA